MIKNDEFLENIKLPKDFLNFMENNIDYGFLTKDNRLIKQDDKNFNHEWVTNYVLETPIQVLNNKIGICFDQVELERYWFKNNKFTIKTFFIIAEVDYINAFPTHTFLAYRNHTEKDWYCFEAADYFNRGIYKFSNIKDLLNYKFIKQLELIKRMDKNFINSQDIHIYEYSKPKIQYNAFSFIDFCVKSKKVK